MGGRYGGGLRRGVKRHRHMEKPRRTKVLPSHCAWCVRELGMRVPSYATGRMCKRHYLAWLAEASRELEQSA